MVYLEDLVGKKKKKKNVRNSKQRVKAWSACEARADAKVSGHTGLYVDAAKTEA